MHDTLSPEAHGLIDYVTVLTFALAPTLFQFDGVPALVAYGLAGAHLVMTLTTRFPMGLFDGVPLRAHGVVELVVSVALIVLPWVAGFVQPGAQWFFPVMGVFVFLIWLLSDYGRLKPVGQAPEERFPRSSEGEGPPALTRGSPPGTRVADGTAEEETTRPGGSSSSEDSPSAPAGEEGEEPSPRRPEGLRPGSGEPDRSGESG